MMSIIAQASEGMTLGGPGIVLLAWLPVAFVIVRSFPAARGIIAAYLIGWLFLPYALVSTPFVPYTKDVVVSLGALLGAMLGHPQPLLALRPKWIDLPMAIYVVVGMVSALANGLTLYDGAAASCTQLCIWGIPYFLGRAYLTRRVDALDLAKAIFFAGLVYVPFCLLEVRFSPFWHYLIYRTVARAEFMQEIRYGGYRPTVFMQHGLAVGMFMTAASLSGFWLWWTGLLRQTWRLPTWIPLSCLLVTTVLVKSSGAIVLLAAGIVLLLLTQWLKSRALLLLLLFVPTLWVGSRSLGGWSGDAVAECAAFAFGTERGNSLQFRLDCENQYIEHDKVKPLFGYGPGNTFMLEVGGHPVIVDSLWIITLSINGAIGLAACIAIFAVPTAMVLYRIPVRQYAHPAFAAIIALAVLVLLYAVDNLVNAMFNPVFMLAVGAVGTLGTAAVTSTPISGKKRKFFGRSKKAAKLQPAGEFDPRVLSPGILNLEPR